MAQHLTRHGVDDVQGDLTGGNVPHDPARVLGYRPYREDRRLRRQDEEPGRLDLTTYHGPRSFARDLYLGETLRQVLAPVLLPSEQSPSLAVELVGDEILLHNRAIEHPLVEIDDLVADLVLLELPLRGLQSTQETAGRGASRGGKEDREAYGEKE